MRGLIINITDQQMNDGQKCRVFQRFFSYNKTCFIVKLNCRDKIRLSAKQVISIGNCHSISLG